MIAPVIDQTIVATTPAAISSEAEAKAADVLTFKIGLAIIAAVIAVMAVVGAVIGSAPLLIAAALTGALTAGVGIYTGVSLTKN
ncbi:MAG: mandelate racemase [Actinomyces urogenitalis]|nr:mandelate racemase [Actinomyces urogenitalis]MDU7428417.1 mandelate racemase [Actinomyces urogenitalis]